MSRESDTIADFLLARFADDEARAHARMRAVGGWVSSAAYTLAECEVNRALVARCDHEHPCDTLRALALPYAGHPDYREEWKP